MSTQKAREKGEERGDKIFTSAVSVSSAIEPPRASPTYRVAADNIRAVGSRVTTSVVRDAVVNDWLIIINKKIIKKTIKKTNKKTIKKTIKKIKKQSKNNQKTELVLVFKRRKEREKKIMEKECVKRGK